MYRSHFIAPLLFIKFRSWFLWEIRKILNELNAVLIPNVCSIVLIFSFFCSGISNVRMLSLLSLICVNFFFGLIILYIEKSVFFFLVSQTKTIWKKENRRSQERINNRHLNAKHLKSQQMDSCAFLPLIYIN